MVRPRKPRSAPKPPAALLGRSYEGEFTQALRLLGMTVVSKTEYLAQRKVLDLPTVVVTEYRPRPLDRSGSVRQWALDFSIPYLKVAAEIDGFYASGGGAGGHRTWGGFHRDREKDRALTLAGWRVLRFGPADLREWSDMLVSADEFLKLAMLARGGEVSDE